MKNRLTILVVFLLCMAAAGFLLFRWFEHDPYSELTRSVPGRDGGSASSGGDAQEIDVLIGADFEEFDGTAAALPGAWPRFRGVDFDNICKADVKLADSWPAAGPEILWSVDLGEGHAAASILNGRVFLMDYDEEKRADALRCFSLADGKEIWRRSYELPAKRNHGLSRTIPAVTEDCVITIGPRCHVMCVETESGALRWGLDLLKEYGTTEPLWFTGQCPLIDDGLAVLAPAGPDVLMLAVDCKTGETVWKTPNSNGWKMSHSSIMPMTLHGRKMYVYCAVGGITGVSAEGTDRGKVLWEIPWSASVIAPSPVPISGNRIFITAGYGAGSLMMQIEKQGDGFVAKALEKHGPKDWLACEQQTPIYLDGLLYGIMPKDAGALKRQLVCYNPDTHKLVWSSGKTNRFGLGPFFLVDGKFFVLSDDGQLTMLKASGSEYVQLAQFKVLDGHDAWGPIALAGTRMLLRDSVRMVCIETGAGK